MKPKEIIQQIEHLMGRQPEGYMIRLMNDGLLDMASKKKEYTVSAKTDLIKIKDGILLMTKLLILQK